LCSRSSQNASQGLDDQAPSLSQGLNLELHSAMLHNTSLAIMVKIANISFTGSFTYLLLEVLMTAVVPHHNAPFVAVFDKQQPP